ncbi:hypothetical protein QYB02_005079, partial [Escherichia coli]|nr:hypothetical protein [Escherichia coli]
MNKKFTKTLLAGAVFSLLASVAQAETLHFSLYQGEYDDQKTNANLSTQKYQMSFDTEAGIGAIFYGTNPDVTANKDKFLFLFDAQGNITRLADGTQVKIHSEDLADFTRSITDGNYDVSGGQYQNIHNMNEGEMRSLIQKVESFKSTIGDINANTDLKVSGVSSEVSKLSARTDVIDLAVGSVDQRVESRTTVGVDADGKLTRVDGATNTIAVNDGLLALSGRTDKIDAAVVAVDSRVSSNTRAVQKNTQAIAANSRQLQEHNA